jgi:hypothetical protein
LKSHNIFLNAPSFKCLQSSSAQFDTFIDSIFEGLNTFRKKINDLQSSSFKILKKAHLNTLDSSSFS